MPQTETLSYFNERLHRRRQRAALPFARLAFLSPKCVTRRFAVRLAPGSPDTIRNVAGVHVRCAEGSVWITHDGDPKDVILETSDSYTSRRNDPMHLHPLQECVVEFEFEDVE